MRGRGPGTVHCPSHTCIYIQKNWSVETTRLARSLSLIIVIGGFSHYNLHTHGHSVHVYLYTSDVVSLRDLEVIGGGVGLLGM